MIDLKKIYSFFTEDLWKFPENNISSLKNFAYNQIRIIVIAIKGLNEDKISLKASALTYYSLWAIIPVMAMIVGLGNAFGFREVLDSFLTFQFRNQPEIGKQILAFTDNYLATINDGVFVGIGVLLLLWSVMNVLGQIEAAFNDIWSTPKSRPFIRKFTDYFAFIIIIPIVVIISFSANIYISETIQTAFENAGYQYVVAPVGKIIAEITPYLLYYILFLLLYMIIPYTKVKFSSAIFPAILVGTAFQLLQLLFVYIQVSLSRIYAIYAGLATFPLLLLLIQIGWTIVLFGAEISFANQNIKNFMYDRQVNRISIRYYNQLSLFIMKIIVRRFSEGEKPLNAEQIADFYKIPVRLVTKITSTFIKAGLVLETVANNNTAAALVPALDPKFISIAYMQQQIENLGESDFVPIDTNEFKNIKHCIELYEKNFAESSSNCLVNNI